MWWEISFLLLVPIACMGIHLPPGTPYEESDAIAEVHPRLPREERRIPEWSQFFYLRTPGGRDKPKGFSYHVENRNIQRAGPYPFPSRRERPEFGFSANDRRSRILEPQRVQRRWHLRDPENDSGHSSESSEESPNTSSEKDFENRSGIEHVRSSREQEEHQRSSRLSNGQERESHVDQLNDPISNRRSNRKDSYSSRGRPVFHDPIANQKGSSRLTQDQDEKDGGSLPLPEDEEAPEIVNTPGRFPHQGAPYGVVDTYLQFPPVSFRFHISPRVHVLRPSDVMINQPIGSGFVPFLPLANSTGPHSVGSGNPVRIHVVATGVGTKEGNQVNKDFPPPREDVKTTTIEVEHLTTPKTSTIIHSLSQQSEHNQIEKLTESTTAETPKVTNAVTTFPTTTIDAETTTTETTTLAETTSTNPSTTTQAVTVGETSLSPATLENLMLEIKTTLIPETTTEPQKEDKKDDAHHTAKTPCNHSTSTQASVPTTEEVSTATSVVETRVDIKTTSAVSEHFESLSSHENTKDQPNNKNEKNNLVFMTAENLELW